MLFCTTALFALLVLGWQTTRAFANPSKRPQRLLSQHSAPAQNTAPLSPQDREVILRLQLLLYMEMLENLKLYQHLDMFRHLFPIVSTDRLSPAKKP